MMKNVYSVGQVNTYIKNMFAQDFMLQRISVKGEVSNCKYHTSGHIYFTLKDGLGAMQAVMFASRRKGLTFRLEEGQQVVVKGSIEVYERDGRYQLYASEITLDGTGDLFRRFEKLRNELEEMGMFSPEYKTPIPKYAKTVGIVTASTGAAIRDIINISGRRNPYVQLVLCPALVQGAGAAPSIVRAIQTLDALHLDVLIVGRGGGSIEDLWAFNEEELVRVVAACTKPIISAVGHETDTTLTDYAADMRAPTPSAAAELAVYSYRDLTMELRESARQLQQSIYHLIKLKKILLTRYEMALSHSSPQDQIRQRRLYLADSEERLKRLLEQKLTSAKHQMALYAEELKGLSPLYKLQGGYAYVADDAGNNIKSIDQLKKGQRLTLTLKDGQADVVVQDVASKR